MGDHSPQEASALRVSLPDEEGIHRNLELEAEGWEKRYLAEPDRAKEAVAMYSSLGYEVKEHKIQPDEFSSACGECPSMVCRTHVMIYTRKKGTQEKNNCPV